MIKETDKYNKLREIVLSSPHDILDTYSGRQSLGNKIAQAIGMFPGRTISFLHEMEGLDFRKADDRQTFLDFVSVGL